MPDDQPTPAQPQQQPQQQQRQAPPTVILQPRESWFGRFGKVLLVLLGLCVMTIIGLSASYQSYFSNPDGPQEKYHSLSKTSTKKIAIISVTGAIMEGDDFVKQQIEQVKNDDNVVAVVLRVNSPGGTVTYSDYLLHHLKKLTEAKSTGGEPLPMVVSMGSICASGGYYIAMAVEDTPDSIFAERTTWTGSIGVIIPHYDFSNLAGEWGIKEDSIASGKFKQMGSPTREMSDEERALFQELVDQSFAHFKEVVMSGRPEFREAPEQLDAIATGQIFTATQAEANGLVDKIGFVEDAVARAAKLAGLSTNEVRCVRYEKTPGAFDALLGEAQAARRASAPVNLRGLLELSTPRAYYLSTLLPAVLESR